MLVLLNVTPSDEMKQEGIAREVVNKIQKLRKKVKLSLDNRAEMIVKLLFRYPDPNTSQIAIPSNLYF